MDPDDTVLFLNRSKNKMVFGRLFSTAAPFYFVITKPAAKVAPIKLIKQGAEVEVFPFLSQV